MAVKTVFEPKDARITFDDRYYSNNFDEKREPKKRITGTQALVEFLNTTSPEEFQKNVVPTKRSSALFFRRRGEKPTKSAMLTKSTTTTASTSPHTIHRKNYIEIIANPFTFNKTNKTNSSPSLTATTTTTAAKNNSSSNIAILGSQLNRTLSKSTSSIYSLPHHNQSNSNNDKPVLPIRKGINPGSHGTQTITAASASTTTNHHHYRRQIPSLRISAIVDHTRNKPVNYIFTSTTLNNGENDMIEGGLRQRLNQYQINSLDIPSNSLSKSLAQEHIAALGVVSSMTIDEQQQQQQELHNKRKKKSRHIQVQTMPYFRYPNDGNSVTVQTESSASSVTASNDNTEEFYIMKQRLEKMEQELKQERLKNSRLQAALEETRDQFEVLSGLAYKKLREVWEEKTRWENACIEAKERCWHDHQQQIMGRHVVLEEDENEDNLSTSFVDGTVMDFMLDQEAVVEEIRREHEEEEEEEEYLM